MSDYLTVSQAAARLGISERTLRKRIKAGEVEAEKRAIDGGGVAWHVQLSHDRAGSEPEVERKNEPEAERKPFESESASERKRNGSEVENAPEFSEPRAGSGTEAGLIDQLRDENAFLRAQIDAWRLQAEAANRTAAEASAALREALKALPKALPGENTPDAEKTTRYDAPQATQTAPGDVAPVAQKQSVQRGTKTRKLTAWQRVAARILGIR
jgi:excisionase family DNA binding protein